MKRKALCALLTLMMVLSLCACGSSSKTSDSGEKSEDKQEEKSEEKGKLEKVSIEEQVLCDQDGVKVTATGLDGFNLNVTVENNTDKSIGVLPHKLAVNNCMMQAYSDTDLMPAMGFIDMAEDPTFAESTGQYMSVTAKAGETVEGLLTVYYEEKCDLASIGLVNLALYIYDGASHEELFRTELTEIQTSAYDKMEELEKPDGTEICNKEGMQIIVTDLEEDESGWYNLELYVDNQSGKDISLSFPYADTAEEAQEYVNGGTMITDGNILSGKKALITTRMSKEVSLFTDNGMEDKERENIIINIYDMNDLQNGFITCTNPVAIADVK